MIDKNKIFDLFGGKDDNEKAGEIIMNAPKDLFDSPIAKIGMFTKLIINHEVFHTKLKKFFEQEGKKPVDIQQTKEASEFTVFNRAWFYLKQIDLKDIEHFNALLDFKPEPLISALELSISYFEKEEEYEKCAVIYEMLLMKKNLENSVPS